MFWGFFSSLQNGKAFKKLYIGELNNFYFGKMTITCKDVIKQIVNNYSPKWRWIVEEIYRAAGEAAKYISTTFTDIEGNNCFSIYHTSWITSGPKSNFICDNIPTKAILFFFGCSEVNSTWLITSELANQRPRKVLFTCVVYTNLEYF